MASVGAPDIFLPPGAPLPGSAPRETLDRPGYDAAALARVTNWISEARTMFERAGVGAAQQGASPRISWMPTLSIASMNAATGTLMLGQYSVTDVPYSTSRDVVVHEYSHAIISNVLAAGAPSSPESVAAQESLADTFAAAVDDDWTMGEDLHPAGGATRSMQDPASIKPRASYGVDRLPSTIAEFRPDIDPHANAGIGNRAAYLIGTALGRDRMAQIYVSALRDHLGAPLSFWSLADATLAAAGQDAKAAEAVRAAWESVGIKAGIQR